MKQVLFYYGSGDSRKPQTAKNNTAAPRRTPISLKTDMPEKILTGSIPSSKMCKQEFFLLFYAIVRVTT